MIHAIVPATTPALVEAARGLVRAYADWLADSHGVSLDFQGIDAELAAWPGRYAPPGGALLLALGPGDTPAGTVALRRLDPATCEIKRLYVAPAARGAGLGARLATAIVAEARRLGYRRAVLDTLPFMAGAQRLYAGLGFRDIAPYQPDPHHGLRFMGRDL